MAQITIERYQPCMLADWEGFVDRSINGTIFHRQRFLAYHPPGRFKDHSLIFRSGSKMIALFPAAEVQSDGLKSLVSHPGASYGGFVFDDRMPLRHVLQILEVLEEHCRLNEFGNIRFRIAEKIFNVRLCDQLEFALLRTGYSRQCEELSTYYDLADFESFDDLDQFVNHLPKTRRTEIRHSLRLGYSTDFVNGEEELYAFYRLLCNNLADKHGTKPTHSLEELQRLLCIFPDDVNILAAYREEKMFGGYLTLSINPWATHIFYACQNYSVDGGPSSLLVGSLLWHCKQRGVRILNYGISTEHQGRDVNWGLLRFKEDFRGTGALRTMWAKDLL